jgi:hypothetical protein
VKRKLILANLVLLALSAAAAVHLRREWIDSRAREEAFLRQRLKSVPPPPITNPPAAEPVRAAGYIDIAQKDLFSKDRNPTVVVEAPPAPAKPPMPKLPLFHGLVDLGDGPMAIMSDGPKAPHRDYQPGDKVGAFTLVSVNSEQIVLEWEGQTITKDVDEMLDRTVAQAPPTSGPGTAVAAPVAAKPVTPAPASPGSDLGRGIKACQPGDSSPDGTVTDGMRKVIKASPFGSKCYWESVN